MSLKVDMDKWDYQEAISAVEKLLKNIEAIPVDEDNAKLEGVPSATEIVDLVWDKIV